MTNPANDIARQARQGSVAAVIQVLNDKLADSGVRTRAMFADGVLQILCEAAQLEQLEQSILVERVRQILDSIAPRNIRRVKINSRIVREQQLLWLEEINRDPENQLLWSEEITLAKPNLFQQIIQDVQDRQSESTAMPKATPATKLREQRQFWRGIFVGGISLGILLALVGWSVSDWLGVNIGKQPDDSEQPTQPSPTATSSVSPASPTASPTPTSSATPAVPIASPTVTPSSPKPQDPFAEAVRLAEQTSAAGKTAQSPADWLALATKWQQASDLMAAVPAKDPRYKTAQDRKERYRQNSEMASQSAVRKRAEGVNGTTDNSGQ